MLTDVKLPLTNNDLLALVDPTGYYRFAASPDTYWELLADADYRVDYYDHHIIATMSYESDIHSQLATELGFILRTIFSNKQTHLVYNSNRPVYIDSYLSTGTGVFNADGMVVSLPRNTHEYRPGLNAETTPLLLIEVLSPSTRAYDFGTKLPVYKQIESLQTILFVEQDKPQVTVMERQGPNRWTETCLRGAEEFFTVADTVITLQQLYRGIPL